MPKVLWHEMATFGRVAARLKFVVSGLPAKGRGRVCPLQLYDCTRFLGVVAFGRYPI